MHPYAEIIRPVNGLMSAIAVYIGSVIGGAGTVPEQGVLIGMLTVFLISSGGMIINDIFDAGIDKINKPKRPIPSGKISKKTAYAYAATMFVLGNAAAFFFLSEGAFYVAIFSTFMLSVYNSKLKGIIMLGHVAISLLVALAFLYGGVIAGNYLPVIPLAALAFLSNIGREIFKTIDDALGDKQHNVNTIAVRYGVIRAKTAGSFFILAAVILSFVPYFMNIFNEIYLFFVLLADIILVASVAAPIKYSSRLIKAGMIVALLAFFVGAYSIRA